jgi:hypothetical protein
MSFQGILGVLTLIVVLAIITTIVARPNSATVIGAMGSFFSNSLRVAMGTAAGR